MNFKKAILTGLAVAALTAGAFAQMLKEGTAVTLAFDQTLSSKTAKAGDKVKLHVAEDVMVNGKTVLKSGTPVTAVVSEVNKRGRFGKNAQLKVTINPVTSHGATIALQPRQKGNAIGGSRGTQAAAVAGAGAVVLGPLGLAGGYFVVGKQVNVKVGDKLETQVSKDVRVH